ncbi:magnesium/cobalt transporter CorA [Aquibacillus sediminis]|uniref:magnesium/cobalt transporter CorA n=1 Tax=Aquibacillus sediminis TaxID=2574734 RepID=UPI0011097554|nr:magnesium/cobalt transporter CorA [Aquibacillus sediminis]
MIEILAITNNQVLTVNHIDDLKGLHVDWYWIDFNQPSNQEIQLMDEKLHFHPLAIEDCMYSRQRPKLDYYDDFTFFVTHAINEADLTKEEHNIFVGAHFIVTFHQRKSKEISQVWNRLLNLNNPSKWDEYRVFYEIIDKIVDNYFPIVYRLEDEISYVEDNTNEESMDVLLDRLFDLRHQLLQLRHTINPVRDLLYRMLNSHHLKGIRERKEYFVDIYDHLLKLSEMVASNREITNDIRDNYLSINTHQTNQVMKVLTIITSIFAPLTFIAGIYGMNFVNMPELETRYGYFITIGVMALVSILMFLWFKRRGWF